MTTCFEKLHRDTIDFAAVISSALDIETLSSHWYQLFHRRFSDGPYVRLVFSPWPMPLATALLLSH